MTDSVVELYNQALSATGHSGTISDITETSREANLCNLWYDTVRKNVMKAAWWPCTRATTSLAVNKERDMNVAWTDGDPLPSYKYAYKLPGNCLAPRYLASFGRFSTGVGVDSGSDINVLFCNETPAILNYSRNDIPLTLWDENLRLAVVLSLASRFARGISGKEGLSRNLLQEATILVREAATEIANEVDEQNQELADWHFARGYSPANSINRYLYPLEKLQGLVI